MKELKANIWDCITDPVETVPCITTNVSINGKGNCVMGRGVAAEAALKFPSLPEMLAKKIREEGNRVHMFLPFPGNVVITFPVKYEWFQRANLDLIAKSTDQLKTIATEAKDVKFYLPRPGCGNGRRDWLSEVKPIVSSLPDNVIIVSL
jgi:hypothetical protein